MNKFLFTLFLVFLLPSISHSRPQVPEASSFNLEVVPVSQLVRIVYLQVYPEISYTLDPAVLQDQRTVSFRWAGASKIDFKSFFRSFLEDLGYSIVSRSGSDFVLPKKQTPILSAVEDPNKNIFIYTPKYRDVSYLVDFLSPLFSGTFIGQKKLGIDSPSSPNVSASGASGSAGVSPEAATPGTLLDQTNKRPDFLSFVGSKKEVAKLSELLEQIDIPAGEILIRAYMYEVGTTQSDSSALGLVASVLGGRFNLSLGGDQLSNLVRLKTRSIDAVASALAGDSRFKVITAPFQRVKSGKSARLVSGSQVSVLGSVVTNNNGSTQQSYDRVESGTILEVSPVVRGEVVDLDLYQEVSSFVKSDISVQPTLNKRELKSSFSVHNGEVLIIAGLENRQNEDSRSGLSFLPFSLSKSKTSSSSQLLLVIQLEKL